MSFAFPAKQQDGAGSGPKQAAKEEPESGGAWGLTWAEGHMNWKRGTAWRPTNVDGTAQEQAAKGNRQHEQSEQLKLKLKLKAKES